VEEYKVVVGFEVHIELNTETKMFCGCKNTFGDLINTNICPVCMGYPGALPVVNQKAVEAGVMAALCLNCRINQKSHFDRKNYFYPDLAKGYQITQYDIPLGENGYLYLEKNQKKIRIKRLHLEEDAGKLFHKETGSFVDYNRAGVPLIEIVTEPDIASATEGREFLETLRSMMEYLGISDAKMEKGSLRCDVNISIQRNDECLGEKVEVKNLNSIKNVEKAIFYETMRQKELLKCGENILSQTRTWDEKTNQTVFMRSKEQAQDYRYFPDPDLLALVIDEKMISEIKESLPELADKKLKRFIDQYDIKENDAVLLTKTRSIAEYFEQTANFSNGKDAAKWILGEVLAKTNVWEMDHFAISAKDLAELIQLCNVGKISQSMGKLVFEEMYQHKKTAINIMKEKNLMQVNDVKEIKKIVQQVLNENTQSINDYFNGKEKAFTYLVGQCMKKSKGMANPLQVNEILKQELEEWA